MRTITVQPRQTIFDIAIQYYGDVEGVDFLLLDNPDLSLNNDLVYGQKLTIRDEVKNSVIAGEFLNYTPVSNG